MKLLLPLLALLSACTAPTLHVVAMKTPTFRFPAASGAPITAQPVWPASRAALLRGYEEIRLVEEANPFPFKRP